MPSTHWESAGCAARHDMGRRGTPLVRGRLPAADPNAPTLCAGWTTRHLCAHLVQREHAILRNVWDQVTTKAPGEERFMRRLVDDAGTPDGYAALVDTFAAGPSRHSLMGRFDEALNLLEYVVHHEDLRRGSGPVPPRDPSCGRARRDLASRPADPQTGLPEGTRRSRARTRRRRGHSCTKWAEHRHRGRFTLELLLHAFGRRCAADVRVDGSSDDVDSFNRWATRA